MAEFEVANLKDQRPGQTQEKTLGPTGEAGVYRHEESGQEAIALWDPILGNAQAEALIRVGFKYLRPAKEGEIKSLVTASLQAEQAKESTQTDNEALKGILARLNALEAENAKLREQAGKKPGRKPKAESETTEEQVNHGAAESTDEASAPEEGNK